MKFSRIIESKTCLESGLLFKLKLVGKWSLGRWVLSGRWVDGSVVGGSVVGGFNKTRLKSSQILKKIARRPFLHFFVCNLILSTVLWSYFFFTIHFSN